MRQCVVCENKAQSQNATTKMSFSNAMDSSNPKNSQSVGAAEEARMTSWVF